MIASTAPTTRAAEVALALATRAHGSRSPAGSGSGGRSSASLATISSNGRPSHPPMCASISSSSNTTSIPAASA